MGHALWELFDSATPIAMLLVYLSVPVVVLFGCIRWLKQKRPDSLPAGLSYAAFWIAAASGVLAVFSIVYGMKTGGAAYYAPSFPRILSWGFRTSALAAVLAVAGIWQKNPLRWHATICSLAMLFYWSTAFLE